ncbi:MAG: hypothetical protein AVDCRST_MAG21-1915 [uncultured Nocardioidaceae bacterium]|uniref:Uncharacterized protein n=1 Tax=uncultured Nocardioidaceae bacterium TaxID=253824 RepID=A0A6J4ND67_9ACTN|nr:MAG: hypothetical protein AVDCRST_MAG21-1915 [uncultured Nocardioidaceae bacterium]
MPEPSRHRRPSTRTVFAVVLLVIAGLVLLTALVLASAAALLVAAVSSYAAGVAGTRMLAAELAQSRRDAARSRAEQAQADTARAQVIAGQHRRAIAELGRRLGQVESVATSLRAELTSAEEQVSDTTRRMLRESRRASARMASLQSSLDRLNHELAERTTALGEVTARLAAREDMLATDDMLATWDGMEDLPQAMDPAEDPDHAAAGVVDLMTWEQRATPTSPRRKHA